MLCFLVAIFLWASILLGIRSGNISNLKICFTEKEIIVWWAIQLASVST
jgi:hypothetical protein